MKKICKLALATLGLLAMAQPAMAERPDHYVGKAIYMPEELKDNDFTSPDSKWSFNRMAATDNIVVFWAKEFGDNITTAPDLDGNNMKVDLANLLAQLEHFYSYFYHDLAWVKPGTKADKYKMMVMLDYTLEGTAYGGSYDDAIGALWVTPNRLQDPRLNCIAHELGHSFQTQIWCDGEGVSWGGNGIFEMASQWMLWQVNPDWQTDEYYHLQAWQDLTHKAFLHIENIYHSPYVLEYWGEKHGRELIAELFRQGKEGEDPAQTYMRLTGINVEQYNDEHFDAARRMVNWDYPRVWDNTRKYACNGWHTKMEKVGNRYMPAVENCPENNGFNVIELTAPETGKKIKIDFRGEAGKKGYYAKNADKAGWRYGLVAVDKEGKSSYSEMQRGKKGSINYTAPADLDHLYLVVMGAPTEHWPNVDGPDNPGDAQWPYSVSLQGTTLK